MINYIIHDNLIDVSNVINFFNKMVKILITKIKTPHIKDYIKIHEHKLYMIEDSKPINRLSQRDHLHLELLHIPPNSLIPKGGIGYQRSLKSFNSLKPKSKFVNRIKSIQSNSFGLSNPKKVTKSKSKSSKKVTKSKSKSSKKVTKSKSKLSKKLH
jgi:hypothetical protein